MRDRIVFISDVHIGIDAATNWYQRELHEPLLLAAFDWVVAHADEIGELVLLGDFVDQWTYLPAVRPPTFAAIAAANPRVFGPGGALPRALDALAGAVTYVGGNHDMSVTAADLAEVRGAGGFSPRLVSAFPYLPAPGAGRLACAHGHQFSVLNAPDPQAMPANGLPIGHVITRLAALWSSQRLAPGQTVVDKSGSGEPSGWPFDKEELSDMLVGVLDGDDALPVLGTEALLQQTGQTPALPIAMLDGTTMTVAAARTAYGDLFHRYRDADHFPGAAYGRGAAYFALIECDLRNRLDHFARRFGEHHQVVVMGHTHCAEDETQRPILFGADNVYVNCGFGCPARPDLLRAQQPIRPTFVDVQLDASSRRATVTVRAIAPTAGGAEVVAAPLHQITVGG